MYCSNPLLAHKRLLLVPTCAYPASVPVFASCGATQPGFGKDSCVVCLFLTDDWIRAGDWSIKEGLLGLRCFLGSFMLGKGHVEETVAAAGFGRSPEWVWCRGLTVLLHPSGYEKVASETKGREDKSERWGSLMSWWHCWLVGWNNAPGSAPDAFILLLIHS